MFFQGLTVQTYTVRSDKLTAPVRIAAVADLHGTVYGRKQAELLGLIDAYAPDIVVFLGDIVDDKIPAAGAEILFRALGEKYPCYYVSGNNEYKSGRIEAIKLMIASCGVLVLSGTFAAVKVKGQDLMIFGVDDPIVFGSENVRKSIPAGWLRQFEACVAENGRLQHSQAGMPPYSVLLSHRPELFAQYGSSGFDLVIAGHAHGGQVRIPGLVNGLFAPGQGVLPRYAGGVYALGETAMVVSRGLCRNHIPRIYNPPELVMIDIKA